MVQERASAEFGMFKLNPKVDDVIEKCDCMCPETAFLRALHRHVILREKDLVILEIEAGIEHLGRGMTGGGRCDRRDRG